MIAIGKHLAAPTVFTFSERRVDVLRRRNLEALHAASERRLVLGFDEHVDVVPLQADVNDTKPLAPRRRDRRLAQSLVHRASPQAAYRRYDANSDVQRVIRLELWPRVVALPGARPARLPSGTTPLAAVPEQLLLDMPLAIRFRRRHELTIMMDEQSVNLNRHI
ncbi:MAG TPA: hypothetical protein VIX73_16915 [Kofleriaceae bacterium]